MTTVPRHWTALSGRCGATAPRTATTSGRSRRWSPPAPRRGSALRRGTRRSTRSWRGRACRSASASQRARPWAMMHGVSGVLRLALAGDTMLGRSVADAIAAGRETLLDPDVVAIAATADLFVVNLECCISERGAPWPDAGKPFFFRAPPRAAELLAAWGVDAVTLANNHALDYGRDALADTFAHLQAAGVAWAGAGADEREARAPRRLTAGERRIAIVAATDHPADFAATPDRAGVAYADLRRAVPDWLTDALALARPGDAALCFVHWGPNMVAAPVEEVRRAARVLTGAGATLVAGHSAHIPHGAAGHVL